MDKNLLGTNAKSRTISYLRFPIKTSYFSSEIWFSGCLAVRWGFFGYNVWLDGGGFGYDNGFFRLH